MLVSAEGLAAVLHIEEGDKLGSLDAGGAVRSCDYSHCGRWVRLQDAEGRHRFWDPEQGVTVDEPPTDAAFGPTAEFQRYDLSEGDDCETVFTPQGMRSPAGWFPARFRLAVPSPAAARWACATHQHATVLSVERLDDS